jgi:hypothetical protein
VAIRWPEAADDGCRAKARHRHRRPALNMRPAPPRDARRLFSGPYRRLSACPAWSSDQRSDDDPSPECYIAEPKLDGQRAPVHVEQARCARRRVGDTSAGRTARPAVPRPRRAADAQRWMRRLRPYARRCSGRGCQRAGRGWDRARSRSARPQLSGGSSEARSIRAACSKSDPRAGLRPELRRNARPDGTPTAALPHARRHARQASGWHSDGVRFVKYLTAWYAS